MALPGIRVSDIAQRDQRPAVGRAVTSPSVATGATRGPFSARAQRLARTAPGRRGADA
jgi:hypothetical protein